MSKGCLIMVTALALGAPQAWAQFVWIDKSEPIEPQSRSLELHQSGGLARPNHWEYGIDLVHGLGGRALVVVCQTFSQEDGEPFRWQACQLYGQYRLSPAHGFRPDISLRAEYVREFPFSSPNQLEIRGVVSHGVGALSWTVNPVYGLLWGPRTPRHSVGLDGGLGLQVVAGISLAMESVTRCPLGERDDRGGVSCYVGPSTTFSAGSVTYSFGCGWGLSEDSDPAQVQLLVGVGL